MLIIKRYRNRRLYDTAARRPVNLSDLERMVRQGRGFIVLDHASGRDITSSVLTAVIGDRAGEWGNYRQMREVLRAVIRMGGHRSMSILKNTVLAGIGFVSLTRQKAEALIDTLVKSGELSQSQRKEAVLELLARAEKTAKETGQKISREFDRGIEAIPFVKKAEFEKLDKKVEALAKRVSQMEKNSAPPTE